jgi:hypothetical protein
VINQLVEAKPASLFSYFDMALLLLFICGMSKLADICSHAKDDPRTTGVSHIIHIHLGLNNLERRLQGGNMKKRALKAFSAALGGLALLVGLSTPVAAAPQPKADICHFDRDAGLYHVINVSQNAVSKHLSQHGDVFPGTFFADVDGDGFGDTAGATDACPNPGFVANHDDAFPADPNEHADSDGDGIGDNADQCPDKAGPPENNGCPRPTVSLGSDLVIGYAGEFGHTGKVGMLFGDGTGGFSLNVAGIGGFTGQSVAAGDLNKDGKDDVVMTQTNGPVYVALGDFSNGLQNSDFTPAGAFTEGAGNCCDRTRVLQLGDVNNDGNLDVAVTMWSKMGVKLGNGDGTFGAEIQSPSTGFDARGMALGDLDGDGKLDLVANHAPGAWWLAVHRGNGDGSFQPGVVIPDSALAVPNIFLRDADGDGDLDIYTGALNGRLKIFTNDGSANFTKTTDLELGTGNQGGLLVVDDLNGDGTPDAVAGTEANNFTNVRIWLSNGSGGFNPADYGPVGSLPRHGVVADINKDGKKDIAMVTVNIFAGFPQDGSLWTMLGNGDGTFQAPTRPVATYRNNFTIAAGNFD